MAAAVLLVALLLSMAAPNDGFVLPTGRTTPGPAGGGVVEIIDAGRGRGGVVVVAAAAETAAAVPSPSPMTASSSSSSLAGPYAVRILPATLDANDGRRGALTWELRPLPREEDGRSSDDACGRYSEGEGARALRALHGSAQDGVGDGGAGDAVACALRCAWAPPDADDDGGAWSFDVSAEGGGDDRDRDDDDGPPVVPEGLIGVLARVMVQSAAREAAVAAGGVRDGRRSTMMRVALPLRDGAGCQELSLSDFAPGGEGRDGARRLFQTLDPLRWVDAEMVDMVDEEGRPLASLPRPCVHEWNVLHRGVGLIVSKDSDVVEALAGGKGEAALPEVYVHRRTSTKRVFPSLYDMFVGGVSGTGEDAATTAAREVAEELGLRRASDAMEGDGADGGGGRGANPLSDELFKCTVCTSYNRCVVSMFAYACDTAVETIAWQEEEVAWGEFVPYEVVRSAGDMSIDRLVEAGVWPGSYPGDDGSGEQSMLTANQLKEKYGYDRPWETWDFVPDGLLVWEAWKSYVRQKAKSTLP